MRRSLDALSVLSADDLADYDIISDGPRSLESSIADLGAARGCGGEPPPPPAARGRFGDVVALTTEDIQTYVQRSLGAGRAGGGGKADEARVWRVYVDGVFGPLTPREVLQLRQAKLSFPSVHLLAGVFSDELCVEHGVLPVSELQLVHEDRCEVLRHCRWVDEVVPDVPWVVHEKFLRAHQVDFVAIDEGTSIDPDVDRDRLKGYDLVKSLRKAIPTRRTNVSTPMPRYHNPFNTQRSNKRAEGEESEPPVSAGGGKGTVRGVPPSVKEAAERAAKTASIQDAVDTPFEMPFTESSDVDPTPFEEPRVDEFGTGVGI